MFENTTPTAGPDDTVEDANTAVEPDAADDLGTEVPDAATEVPDAADSGPERKLSDEAARHRIAARAAETKLAIAEAHITELQKAEVNRIFKDRFASPDDAWLLPDVTVDSMLVDGKVDPHLVYEVADQILEARPHWRIRPRPLGAPAAAVQGDGKAPGDGAPSQPGWAEILRAKTTG